jgi:hypothetical protein
VALVAALVAAGLWAPGSQRAFWAGTAAHREGPVVGHRRRICPGAGALGNPPEQVTSETRAFMGEVQRNLERRGASGQIVLVGEAVLAGNVPDITAEVRREVYTRVKMPQPQPVPAPT